MADRNLPLDCECGLTMERVFTVPMIAGDTVASGENYHYYDHALGRFIHGRQDRRDEMARQGVVAAEPNPDDATTFGEMRYIRKHSEPTVEAKKAIQRLGKDREKKRREKIIKQELAKVKLD